MGGVKVGAPASISSYLLPDIFTDIVHRFPKIKLTVLPQTTPELFEKIRRAEVDFAVVLTDTYPTDLHSTEIAKERFCLVISPTRPLGRKNTMTPEELRRLPLVISVDTAAHTKMVERELERNGITEYNGPCESSASKA